MLLSGPLLPIAYRIKRWANASSFDRPDRWASVRAFAVMAALPYLALGLLLLSGMHDFWAFPVQRPAKGTLKKRGLSVRLFLPDPI